MTAKHAADATGIESNSLLIPDINSSKEASRTISFDSYHLRLIQVVLADATDRVNELVHEHSWLLHPSEQPLELSGNLFIVEDLENHGGTIFVKQAPLPHARPVPPSIDIRIERASDRGYRVALFSADKEFDNWAIVRYNGGKLERIRSFHSWQTAQRPETLEHRTPRFLSNTWGDRSRDGRIEESFILKEIDAAALLGVDIIQLDDGWQKGISSNSSLRDQGGVWEGFWHTDPEFWEVHPTRLPNGLEPLVAHARERGLAIGLWFAPDSAYDFVNWEKDANRLLELHRQFDICHFKIDGVKAQTPLAFENLRAFFSRVQNSSNGRIVFDLDITAAVRPGYFGEISVGPLFVENRYTDWHNYWPHQTLRNLWKLARWIDPRRLRMEFLNNERNRENYIDDPLAPANYRPDTLFAIIMFANPLGWFEASNLSDTFVSTVAPLVETWKSYRDQLFSGTIIPIGDEPDGYAWTGFLSVAEDGRSGYVLVFRELAKDAKTTIPLPETDFAKTTWEVLAGEGTVEFNGTALEIAVPEKLGFVFACCRPV